jgi:CHRD domain/PEP-CTERM motif
MKLRSAAATLATFAALAATTLPAQASLVSFATMLSSAGEPVPTSTATGNATVVFDDVALTVRVVLNWAGLANARPFGHIHCCTAVANTGNAPVALDFAGLTPDTTGSFEATFTPLNFNTIFTGAKDGKAYVNIHTPGTYQAGEIRGFLQAVPVPEPGSMALVVAALGLAGFAARRKSA